MCCFSGKVEVSGTNIFARASKEGRQFLVYSMQFQSADEVAMILPIPTPKASSEDAVKFINLEKYEKFFDDLQSGFPVKKDDRGGKGAVGGALGAGLAVVEVGKFVASFVPAIKDFERLDKQFRLPEGVWEKLPQYKDFGFAVFKLKKPAKRGDQRVHPMAFEFPREDKKVLFFPTVHIHDGTVPGKAKFDHSLYCQTADVAPMNWAESPGLADSFMKVKESQEIIDGKAHVYRKQMVGTYENKDVGIMA